MGIYSDLLGTLQAKLQIGLGNSLIKAISGGLSVRNSADTADAEVTASIVNVSGNGVVLNSAATETGGSWTTTVEPAATGMTANVALFLPPTVGTSGQAIVTDGSGNLSFASVAGSSSHQTTLNFNSSSPLALFTLPANATIDAVEIVIYTAFSGGVPTLAIGVSGTTNKYVSTTQVDLTQAANTSFIIHPGLQADGSSEALIATYTANSASAGVANIVITYH